MAMQIGLTRIALTMAVGYGGTIMAKNGKLADILGELQNLLKRREDSGEDGEGNYSDAIANQVQRLAMEVRHLASARQITVLNGNSGQSNLSALVVPAATLGVVGYGYMWWKGLTFSHLMYVTKENMSNAVANLTKHLDHVSGAIAATKRHLTQIIENLDGKLDEQVVISKLIRNDVKDACDDLSQLGFDVYELQRLVSGLDDRLLSFEGKQELAHAGVMYLCSLASGKNVKMPEMLQDQFKAIGNIAPSPTGFKEIVDSLSSGNYLLTDGNVHEGSNKLNKPLMRTTSRR